jgi:hypothetical protein
MTNLSIPFWLVSERKYVLNPPATIPCADPAAVHAFTTAEKLAQFMQARGGARWEINQVTDREGVIVAVAELHSNGATKLCINPEPDGSGGLLISLSDVLEAYKR